MPRVIFFQTIAIQPVLPRVADVATAVGGNTRTVVIETAEDESAEGIVAVPQKILVRFTHVTRDLYHDP